MGLNQTQDILSETTEEQGDTNSLKLVPISESIRYRKRAQNAEKKVGILSEQLAHTESETTKISEQLNNIQLEQKLAQKLTAAGVIDLEVALLVSKARLGGSDELDFDKVVEQLKKEKQYLFTNEAAGVTGIQKTAGAKERTISSQAILERAAKRAAVTGNRTDLQEYLKLRRNFI